MEAGVVLDTQERPIYWHLPEDRSTVLLPDSSKLWDVMWTAHQAGRLGGFAHSHPGEGLPFPSITDSTTFAAIETGLGRPLKWWICSSDKLILIQRLGTDPTFSWTRLDRARDGSKLDPITLPSNVLKRSFAVRQDLREPGWLLELRRHTYDVLDEKSLPK